MDSKGSRSTAFSPGKKVNADKSKVKVLGTEVSVDVRNWRMFRSFSILDLFWINLVWMKRMLQESDV